MPQFAPDQVGFNDPAGYGAWDIGHYREHIQFLQILAQRVPAVILPDFDFMTFLSAGNARRSIIESHSQAHELLRNVLNVSGIDLSAVDMEQQGDFYTWIGFHATEHATMRKTLGII